jgi:hypothetical protein
MSDTKIEQDPLWFHRRAGELKEEVAVLKAQLTALEQNLSSSAIIRKLGEYFGFGAAGKLDWARFMLDFKQEELDRFEARGPEGSGQEQQLSTIQKQQQNQPNLMRGKKMDETHFTDITITGNSKSKSPRREGINKDGKAQFIITFTLSQSASGRWIETFNRVWKEHSEQTHSSLLPIVKDDQIQISCPLDDQLQGYLEDIKREAATTNQLYREQLRVTDEQRRNNDEILQKLRF